MKLQHYGVLHCVPLFPFHAFSGSSAVEDEVPHTHARARAHARMHKSTMQNCVSLLGEQNDGTLKIKASLKAYSEDFSSLFIRSPSSGLFLNKIRCNK